jgi:hypothetical protein
LEQLQSGDPERVGQYLLLGRLGAGGMGQVFLGRSPGGRLVSVKVIRAEMAADPEFRARFVREVAAARKVNGLFTAAVVDADPEARLPWLVTNFVNGPSLTQAVAEHGALPPSSHKYQVIAIRDGKLSPRSHVLDLDAVTPPVSDAVLTGTWTALYALSSTSHFTWSGAKSWSDRWAFTPVCQSGPCSVTLAGKFNGSAFTASLTRAGAVYAGTAPLRHWAYCNSSKTYIPSTLSIRIQIQDAGVTGLTWTASSWRGTATVNIAKTKCNPAKVNTNVSSS